MLDGFVVPHAHFRVFHGNAAAESTGKATNAQIPLLFHAARAESMPTDLHLREFAQLEAQVKSLSSQRQQLLAGSSGLVGIAQAAALAECISFYALLMTPESFAWPDFLTTVVVKLVDHFVTNDNDLVRKAILDVFSSSRAHVARVVDASKIFVSINGLLSQESTEDRTENASTSSHVWALRLVKTVPSLVANNASVRASVLKSLTAMNGDEQVAAIHAVKAMLPHSRILREPVWKLVTETKSPTLVTLLPLAFEVDDAHAAEKAWNICASLFHEQVGDDHALLCLQAAGQIAATFPDEVVLLHLQLVQYVVVNDPRPLVISNVWATLDDVKIGDASTRAIFFDVVLQHLQSSRPVAAKANALILATRFCETQGEAPAEVVDVARGFVSSHAQYKVLYVKLLAHCSKWELLRDTRPDQLGYLQKLIQFLAPGHFFHRRKVWQTAIEAVKTLTNQFPGQIGKSMIECHLQLLHIARRKNIEQLECELWLSLSRVSHHSANNIVTSASELLSEEAIACLDEKTKQAIAVCIIQAATEDNTEELTATCLRLTSASASDRYDVARVAMCRGVSSIALRLLEPIAYDIDHECFGSWLRALVALNESEEMVRSSRSVTMNAHHRLITAKALLEAVVSSKFGFDFQVRFIQARITWMDLVLRAQQYAGEIAYTKRHGGERERRLSEAFSQNAEEFVAIRSKMLSATALDLDILTSHAQLSVLLATATLNFLTDDQSKNSRSVELPPSPHPSSPIARQLAVLTALAGGVNSKAVRLSSVDATRRPLVGATVFSQLLQTACALPSLLPRLFFRSLSHSENSVRCNVQFLTHAEATSYTSKPRPRSQLGVAHGTDFTSSLHGSIVFPTTSRIRENCRAVTIKIKLVCEKPEAGVVFKGQVVQETNVRLSKAATLESGGWLYVPLEVPVHVSSELMKVKGTYAVHATVSLIDSNHETWHIASTGGRRNIIVY